MRDREISFKEALELIISECKISECSGRKCKISKLCKKYFELAPCIWEMDDFTKGIKKLKEKENE